MYPGEALPYQEGGAHALITTKTEARMKKTKQLIVGLTIAGIIASGGSAVLAHNAAHIHLPNGECRDVGSGKHAHNPEQQDKDPSTPGDEFGARHGADQGNSRIYPRFCDDPRVDHNNE